MKLSNINIKLRALEPEDLHFLFQIENEVKLWEVSHTLAPFSKYMLKQFIENATEDIYTTKQQRFTIACIKTNIPLGFVDLFDFNPFHNRVGVGIVIDEKYQNQNYASEALEILITYVFDYLGVHQIYANITTDNQKSIKLFTKFGFECCGIKKEWIKSGTIYKDEALYQRINNK